MILFDHGLHHGSPRSVWILAAWPGGTRGDDRDPATPKWRPPDASRIPPPLRLLRGSDSTVLIDGVNEPQPDVLLGIPLAAGGRTRLVTRNGKRYVDGAPELVIEVAAGTASIDLNAKLAAYQRNGVGEYLVLLTEDQREVRWLSLVDNHFEPIPPDANGLLKSRLFPGLWLDPAALLAGDLPGLLAALDAGCATEVHRRFAAGLMVAGEAGAPGQSP